jgi:enoyl-CoA hydratase
LRESDRKFTKNIMSAFKTLIYEKEDSIGFITLNRPNALNAYNIQMRDDLFEILSAIRDDDEVHVAVLNGAGEKAFCAGADLSEFLTAPPPVAARKIRFNRDVWGLFLSIQQPMIAALHGYVLGSGIEIALCCDIRIASDDARFGLPEVGLGIIPAAGGTQTLPRTVGRAYAMELLLTGKWVDAERALQMGLVNQIVPRDQLMAVARKAADKIAAFDIDLCRRVKQAIVLGMDVSLSKGLKLEKLLASRRN